ERLLGVDDSVVTLGLPIGNVLADLVDVRVDVAFLACEKRRDGSMKITVADPMARPRRLGNEAACDLVLALRPRLELGESLANAVVDALVVAGLEVEAVEVGAAAPVAAVERRAAAEADCRSDRHAVVARKHDDQVVRHRSRDRGKEL